MSASLTVIDTIPAAFFDDVFRAISKAGPDLLDNFDMDAIYREATVAGGVPRDVLRYPAPWERELRQKRRRAAQLGWARRRASA